MAVTQTPLLGKVRLQGTIAIKTGLHIGGGGETLDIGGIDKPIIRDPLTRQPYLPGSSIKGKLRAILERLHEKPLNRKGSRDTFRYESDDLSHGFTDIGGEPSIPFEGATSCQVSRLFGSTGVNCWILRSVAEAEAVEILDRNTVIRKQHPALGREQEFIKVRGRNSPAKLIVRDCHLDERSAEELKRIDTGLYMTEWKFENGIDRVTAAANPRQIERVPAGSEFEFELVYTIENTEQAIDDLKNIIIALSILQDDALGGHGSRGYGKVSFKNLKFFCRNREEYINPSGNYDQPFAEFPTLNDVFKQFGTLTGEVQKFLPGSEGNHE